MGRLAKAAVPIVAALISIALGFPQIARAQASPGSAEQALFESANRERAARGLPVLRWDNGLAKAARQHALRMVEHNALSHQFAEEPDLPGRVRQFGANFAALAENVADGPSATDLHKQWMQSPPHRANLLDPKLNSLGVAVEDRDGQLFAVEDFSQAISAVSLEEQEKDLGALLKARGLSLVSDRANAQQVCENESAYNPNRRAAFQVRYSTEDLAHLPEVLLRELHSDIYHSAAVAACAPSHPNNFSGYQIAVLLYK